MNIGHARHTRLVEAANRAEEVWDEAINTNGVGSPLNEPARRRWEAAEAALIAFHHKHDGIPA